MRIISIVGARPQFIKLAALSARLSDKHEEIIVHTGQHYDYEMSEKIFSDLGIRNPDYHLAIGSGTHATQTGEMMKAIEEVIIKRDPGLVVIFGDTNTTLAGAMAASKINVPLVHVEAGLRSYNRNMPEEINRIVADHVSDYLFAPTGTAEAILKGEGLSDKTYLTGDIMVDTLSKSLPVALEKSKITRELEVEGREFNLLTLHRNYNVDNPEILVNILDQLDLLGELIIFPVHPRTRKMIVQTDLSWKNISLVEPLGYLDFIAAQHYSMRIITDSGGIQKEAFILGRPCITLRTETEWVETVDTGWNLLVDPRGSHIADVITSFRVPESQENVFGEDVSSKMAAIIDSI
ncbi:MAG: UDP-N-acetylglucosamine 2-epimerase (non-hydrolyzing) [Marinilabiliales bacterium]|nr:MAG: UDP-N-acetylglucosamine 2-epimerase (non-hydrolyzing) [Marinilabiliales bacterium]